MGWNAGAIFVRVSIHDNSDTKDQKSLLGKAAKSTEVHFLSRAEDTVGELTRNRESASPRFCTKVSEL
jgi:hypothetical protein